MGFFIKLLLKAGITLGVMFIAYKYILTGGTGGFQIPDLSSISEKIPGGVSELENAVVEKDVTVYQWVDDKGVTHFGGTPPTGQGTYDKKEIRANTNLLNAYKAPEVEDKTPAQRSRVSKVGSLYSPEGVKNLMDDAKGTSDQLSDRAAEQQKMLDELMGK
ncbi:MAG: DUF4124 domain-containing protein [Gammaproteobacteria bacterium]|nr:DUF4124 domain-containing protein [Gammaproteobacteria bacterium]